MMEGIWSDSAVKTNSIGYIIEGCRRSILFLSLAVIYILFDHGRVSGNIVTVTKSLLRNSPCVCIPPTAFLHPAMIPFVICFLFTV